LYGHPRARHLRAKEWRPFYVSVRDLFRRNTRHPALLAAVQIMGVVLDPGMEPRKRSQRDARWLRWRELSRINDVKRRRALTVATAVFALLREQSALLPNDGVCLNYAMAQAVLRMRELSGYSIWNHRKNRHMKRGVWTPSSVVVGPLGEAIRANLSSFMRQVSDAIERERDARNRQLAAAPTQ